MCGAVLPVFWLVRAGWRRGRTVVTVIAAAGVALSVLRLVTGGANVVGWITLAVVALVFGGGLVLLHRDPVDAYLRAATR